MGSDDDPVAIALERAAKRAARIADLNGAGQELLDADLAARTCRGTTGEIAGQVGKWTSMGWNLLCAKSNLNEFHFFIDLVVVESNRMSEV